MSLEKKINSIGRNAKAASHELSLLTNKEKNLALLAASKNLKKKQRIILDANKKDLLNAEKKNLTPALMDRLKLDEKRIDAICNGLVEITKLKDPVGQVLSSWKRPNGLKIEKISVPLGVIGVIYESRPNVAADAAALCLKSSNATILRGGSESFYSSSIIIDIINETYNKMDLPKGTLQKIPTTDRDAVGYFLKLDKYIDVFVPRGGRSLIERVIKESRVPVFRHLDGICHTYIHKTADKKVACNVVVNAKMRRPGICGATETLLIDKDVVGSHLPLIVKKLKEFKCEIRADEYILNHDKSLKRASKKDWETEYLDSILSIKTINGGVEEAIAHINNFGSGHTDSIIAKDLESVDLFLKKVDSGIVMHNTSTQFADGGEFGMGAEIGISTSKLHARGPVGVAQLTSFKYKVKGSGQIRK